MLAHTLMLLLSVSPPGDVLPADAAAPEVVAPAPADVPTANPPPRRLLSREELEALAAEREQLLAAMPSFKGPVAMMIASGALGALAGVFLGHFASQGGFSTAYVSSYLVPSTSAALFIGASLALVGHLVLGLSGTGIMLARTSERPAYERRIDELDAVLPWRPGLPPPSGNLIPSR